MTSLPQLSYSITPFSCGGTYEAADPSSGALYTETAIGHVTSASVNEGTINVSLSTSGGTADANLVDGSSTTAYLAWADTLTVTGPPPGTPVTLRVTLYLFGSLQISGNENAVGSLGQQTILIPSTGAQGAPCSAYEANFENSFTTSTSINSRQYFDLCTTSGATLTLDQEVQDAEVSGEGNGSWTVEANLNDSVYVDSLTAGAAVISASTTNYATPGFVPCTTANPNPNPNPQSFAAPVTSTATARATSCGATPARSRSTNGS